MSEFKDKIVVITGGAKGNGKCISFSNDMVIRYLEGVTVLEDGYEVQFKAGLEVTI